MFFIVRIILKCSREIKLWKILCISNLRTRKSCISCDISGSYSDVSEDSCLLGSGDTVYWTVFTDIVRNTGTYSWKGIVSHSTRPESSLYYYFLISTGSIRSYHVVLTDGNNNWTHHCNLKTGRGKLYHLCLHWAEC